MKKNRIYIFIAILIGIGLAIAAGVGFYLYNKAPESLKNKASDFTITALDLYTQYETNETNADQQYLDKVLEVSGNVAEILENTDSQLTLLLGEADQLSGVSCTIDKLNSPFADEIQVNDYIILRGRCTGKLMDVVLIDCIIQNIKKYE